MKKLTKENIEFLTELSKEMKGQDTLGTAHPRLWVIRDVKNVPTSDDYADGYQPFDEDNFEELDGEDLDDLILQSIEDEGSEKLYDFIAQPQYLNLSIDQLEDWNWELKAQLLSQYGYNIKLIPYMESTFVVESAGSFFTNKAAKEHINANRHHYSNNVHPYCIHAWRNPEMERIVKIIEQTDWSL